MTESADPGSAGTPPTTRSGDKPGPQRPARERKLAAPGDVRPQTERDRAMARARDTYGNKLWRLTHLYKIRVKKQVLVPFRPNNIQQRILSFCDTHFLQHALPIRAFFLKYRQGGVSTLWLLWWLDEAVFMPNTINGVLSHEHPSLKVLAGVARTAFINMPEALKPPLAVDNMGELVFGHGKLSNGHYTEQSKMFVSLNIRSTPVHNLHISEHAHCSPEDIAASVGAVPPHGGITAETTAAGMNHAYETYNEGKLVVQTNAPLEPGVLKAAFFPWFIQEEYRIDVPPGFVVRRTDEETAVTKRARAEYGIDLDDAQILYRRKLAKDTKQLRPQEFPENDEEAFLSSGNPFFNAQKVLVMIREARECLKEHPPVEETDDYTMWARPVKGHVYAAGADCAGDSDGDWSTLKIIDVTAREEVFRLRVHASPQRFYKILDQWGRYYNNALLAPERNNHGHAVLMGLDETCHYPNLYYEASTTRPRIQVITGTKSPAKEKRQYGWLTDTNSRPLCLDQLRHATEGEVDDDVENFQPAWHMRDIALCQEMLTFTEQDGKYQAAPGKHDDLIFATAIAHQMYLRLARYATATHHEVRSEPRTYRVDEEDRERF